MEVGKMKRPVQLSTKRAVGAVGFAIALCLVAATVFISVADFLLSAEGDPRLSIVIVIWGWALAVTLGVLQFRSAMSYRCVLRPQFRLSALLCAIALGSAVIYWTATEIRSAFYRRALLADFLANGGDAYLDKMRLTPFMNVTATRLVVRKGMFSDDFIAKLKAAFPEGCVLSEEPRKAP
jgi:hypothetical protein